MHELEVLGFRLGNGLLHSSNHECSVLQEQMRAQESAQTKQDVIEVSTQELYFSQPTCNSTMGCQERTLGFRGIQSKNMPLGV